MPYIKKQQRSFLDRAIHELVQCIELSSDDPLQLCGPTNYVLTRIVAQTLKPASGWSYHSLSRAIAVLRDAATEMERRLMAPYEQGKRGENGDVPEYEYENPFPASDRP